MGEYVLHFGKYKGKLFRWLLENDIGYAIYLMKTGNSLLSFLDYARSFQEVEDPREYLSSWKPASPVASEGDTLVGFGVRAKDTWAHIWRSRADGYAAFIVGVKCIKNRKMSNLQQYIVQQQRAESGPPPAPTCRTPGHSNSAVPEGTFRQALRSDHTRKVARKVVLSSGTMSLHAVMNENWMILS
ncbi:hypothetical protein EYF80_054731 [Liparis tanakae]|uniref:Uncharacterized protein n=1 Tax=Liparis tanakae TaxID=230148 RepID=A0A4Z2F3N9_9TELE|nr:hypothetical protein EYF80_054731 [Liparis tanakae]